MLPVEFASLAVRIHDLEYAHDVDEIAAWFGRALHAVEIERWHLEADHIESVLREALGAADLCPGLCLGKILHDIDRMIEIFLDERNLILDSRQLIENLTCVHG